MLCLIHHYSSHARLSVEATVCARYNRYSTLEDAFLKWFEGVSCPDCVFRLVNGEVPT